MRVLPNCFKTIEVSVSFKKKILINANVTFSTMSNKNFYKKKKYNFSP